MAKPKKKEADGGTVRLNPRLASKVGKLAKLRGKTVDELIAPFLGPWIDGEYEKALEKEREEMEREKKGSKS